MSCFSNQDQKVRYYACESMYNIAKVAKGEVLRYFNSIFDALCKVWNQCKKKKKEKFLYPCADEDTV